jgi:hypothetical protein
MEGGRLATIQPMVGHGSQIVLRGFVRLSMVARRHIAIFWRCEDLNRLRAVGQDSIWKEQARQLKVAGWSGFHVGRQKEASRQETAAGQASMSRQPAHRQAAA